MGALMFPNEISVMPLLIGNKHVEWDVVLFSSSWMNDVE
jgi:hypothetical protein